MSYTTVNAGGSPSGDCQGISAATEWNPTAMVLGCCRLSPIPIIRQSGLLPFRITDSVWLAVLEKISGRVRFAFCSLGFQFYRFSFTEYIYACGVRELGSGLGLEEVFVFRVRVRCFVVGVRVRVRLPCLLTPWRGPFALPHSRVRVRVRIKVRVRRVRFRVRVRVRLSL